MNVLFRMEPPQSSLGLISKMLQSQIMKNSIVLYSNSNKFSNVLQNR